MTQNSILINLDNYKEVMAHAQKSVDEPSLCLTKY